MNDTIQTTPTIVDLPELATVRQVAAFVQVHPRTVRTWMADGRLKFCKVAGKAVRILRADVERLLASGSQSP